MVHSGAPLLAAGLGALLPGEQRRLGAGWPLARWQLFLLLSCARFWDHFGARILCARQFSGSIFGATSVQLGWVLDPLDGDHAGDGDASQPADFYLQPRLHGQDENFTRFFCFLALFAAAMLGMSSPTACCCCSSAGNWSGWPPIC
jgi:NADH-quinone oxidoreductase subunit L